MAAEVRRLGNGEVFVAENVEDFTVAVQKVLVNKSAYQSVYTPDVLQAHSWERQAENLVRIYNRIAAVSPQPREHLPFSIIN
jgi:hypothetical protein